MTTTTTRPKAETAKAVELVKPAAADKRRERTRQLGREIGTLAVNVYERGIADIVAFEKDAAKITPYPWAKNALTVSAGLIEDVGAAYVRTARQILR
ncbi:putative methyltransferase [Actinoplanes octamycinicus]|uniref:Putative methyltransferase n=1 Tax=Actinoplanes octamycinicus TaxID=135948 RepID=A0A7W7MAC0_9ACTN|nr:hypothetical protein [Actinoplanes octamycinicus]MBB4742879.1 putative methyltransferase [Actinoplanes octamycinicus]GIE58268.1 hypothetical protein Aoc01nite_36700 [Actinoplanes octamycinicus]